jgi:ubiquinone/menaquinone biosynthesis C-methylase UbiE
MPLLSKLKQYFRPLRQQFNKTRLRESEPVTAYDIWAGQYDNQPDNLMLALDERLCSLLLDTTPITARVIADVGCGTGRHWSKLYGKKPARLLGFDVSQGMLDVLQEKYPQAETRLLRDTTLPGLDAASCDLVISTLTIAHIPDPEAALTEWNRVLKPGGLILLTDYHPEALAKGGQRTFRDKGKTIAVRNHIHPVSAIKQIAEKLGLVVLQTVEQQIDQSMRPWYEKQNAIPLFERYLGVPIIYGIQLKKSNVAD